MQDVTPILVKTDGMARVDLGFLAEWVHFGNY